MQITFKKSGRVIKSAIDRRMASLREQIECINHSLVRFLESPRKMRAYLIACTLDKATHHGHPSAFFPPGLSREECEEITRLVQLVAELEQETHKLRLMKKHLDDDEVFELEYRDLVGYGFDT